VADKTQTEQLAVFGGEKTVTESLPPWPFVTDEEIEAVRQALIESRTDWSQICAAGPGGRAQELEERFASELGVAHAIATCGGGPSLHMACMSVLEMGDEVITSPFSWGQTVSCILQAGGVPIFADIHPETLTLDPEKIEEKITEFTKAILLVHIGGIPADMDPIMEIARRHGLIVISDCAQAQGSLYKGRQVGSMAHYGCFSIGSGKNIAAGDGGMLVTDDRELYERALLAGMHPLRTVHQIAIPELKERIDSFIYTYRINALTAALALKMFDRLEQLNQWRRRNVAHLAEVLEGVPGIRPQDLPEHLDPAWHIAYWTFVGEGVPGVSREQYLTALQAEGVPIAGSYVGTPIHMRRTFQRKEFHYGKGYPWAANPRNEEIVYREGDCPVAEKRCRELDMLMYGGHCWKDVSSVTEQIGAAFRKVTAQIDRLREIQV
jgi:dTDP-4-amino-4,6-dideoxygalactose transaminase